MRKPTIQAKPKMHRPIIPVGGKVVSTMPAQTYQAAAQVEAMTTTPPPTASVVQSSVPLKTSVEDVNGFANLPSNVKVILKIVIYGWRHHYERIRATNIAQQFPPNPK